MKLLDKLSCLDGDRCQTWFTCGRGHDFPSVDHSKKNCALDYLRCVAEHYRHECAHDFKSGPWVEYDRVGSASCACGLSAVNHDLRHAP